MNPDLKSPGLFFEEIMKQIVKTTIITFLTVHAIPAWAQTQVKIAKTAGTLSAAAPISTLSKNLSAAVERTVAEARLATLAQPAFIPAPPFGPTFPQQWEHPTWRVYIPEPETVRTRSWLEQQKRNFKAWQLKRIHAKQLELQAQIDALPKLQPAKTFRVGDLKDLLVTNLQVNDIPALPVLEHPDYLYRGLGLNSNQDISNILTNGLRVQDVGHYSNGLILTLAASPHDAAAVSSSKYTNLTRDPQIALHYALRNSRGIADRVAVIVGVRGENRRGPIIQVQHDIPASRVPLFMALLNVEGIPTWCRIQLQEGEFVVTPYENK